VVVAVADEPRRERILAVLYERPGPHGFGDLRAVCPLYVEDALDELAGLDAPTSNDAARARYEARIRERARRRATGGGS
jgi:hypothetical protein